MKRPSRSAMQSASVFSIIGSVRSPSAATLTGYRGGRSGTGAGSASAFAASVMDCRELTGMERRSRSAALESRVDVDRRADRSPIDEGLR